jgi:hypothetical protein
MGVRFVLAGQAAQFMMAAAAARTASMRKIFGG